MNAPDRRGLGHAYLGVAILWLLTVAVYVALAVAVVVIAVLILRRLT